MRKGAVGKEGFEPSTEDDDAAVYFDESKT
jgi:hypothetical protein